MRICWHSWGVHLIPAERAGHRIIDGERVCQAIEALGRSPDIGARAKAFALLGDPTRLTILTCIKAAGPISVSDLAVATRLNDTTVSQTLRHLRAASAVSAERDGRVIRYRLAVGLLQHCLISDHLLSLDGVTFVDIRCPWSRSLRGGSHVSEVRCDPGTVPQR